MDNEIKKYCEQCKFYSVLGCQSTLLCTNGNKFRAADVQPVKHGRWICNAEYCKRKGYKPSGVGNYYWCSECDGAEQKPSDFCPNCGARMDGEQND